MPKFNVKAYGAIGDGQTLDTKAVQGAIDACHKAGGGIVELEGGRFICGTLYLRSNVELHIEISAVLAASGDITQFGSDTHYNRYSNESYMDRCFIYAEDAENIALTGRGEINGNAQLFPNENCTHRPMMIRMLRCKNIKLSDLRLNNAAAWTTAFLDSSFIWAQGLSLVNLKNYNGDGLDFDGCHHVYVSDTHIEGTDDNLCLQAGSKKYPVHDIHITNCSFTSICAGVRIGMKSIGDIYNVTISNCTFHNIWREGVKIECTEGGTITDISIVNLVMRNVRRPFFFILNNRLEDIGSSVGLNTLPEIGTMERIIVNNLVATDDEEMKKTHLRFDDDIMGSPAFNGIRIDAAKGHPIRDVKLRDITYTAIGGVKLSDIPKHYPEVKDKKLPHDGKVSENYYPDWSRAAFMDVRNVEELFTDNLIFKNVYKDERPDTIIDNKQYKT